MLRHEAGQRVGHQVPVLERPTQVPAQGLVPRHRVTGRVLVLVVVPRVDAVPAQRLVAMELRGK